MFLFRLNFGDLTPVIGDICTVRQGGAGRRGGVGQGEGVGWGRARGVGWGMAG